MSGRLALFLSNLAARASSLLPAAVPTALFAAIVNQKLSGGAPTVSIPASLPAKLPSSVTRGPTSLAAPLMVIGGVLVIEYIFSMASRREERMKNFINPHQIMFADLSELPIWLGDIKAYSESIHKPISIYIDANPYGISISYQPENETWHYSNANRAPVIFSGKDEANLLSLAKEIRAGLLCPTEDGPVTLLAAAMGSTSDHDLKTLTNPELLKVQKYLKSREAMTPGYPDFVVQDDLLRVCINGDLDTFKRLNRPTPINPNFHSVGGWTPLGLASHYGHLDMVIELLANGADPRHFLTNDSTEELEATLSKLDTIIAKPIKAKIADLEKAEERAERVREDDRDTQTPPTMFWSGPYRRDEADPSDSPRSPA